MKCNIYLVFLITLITLNLINCVFTRKIKYDNVARNPKPAYYEIEIYKSTNIERPYKIIGIVQANAGKFHDPGDTLEKLKNEARKMGGDALLDLTAESTKGRIIIKQPYGYISGNVREKWSAKVIVWVKENNSNDTFDE